MGEVRLGDTLLSQPYILAPLAGYTDLAFRLLCREYGAALCYSEMISCHGLVYQKGKTLQMLQTVDEERPVTMQLFGNDPEIMGEAAAILSEYPIDCIDINMGCPVKKVTKKGSGAALMKTPALAAKIIANVAHKTPLPISVKIRSGWNHDQENAPEFAKRLQDAGASLVAVHARTWSDGFSGTPDLSIIAKVKKAVSIPVIGNGDLHSYQDGLDMMEKTGCDGVMIGRAALGAPWIFAKESPLATLELRSKALKRHLELFARYFPTDKLLPKIKNHVGRYFKGISGGAGIRKAIYECRTYLDLCELSERLLGAGDKR